MGLERHLLVSSLWIICAVLQPIFYFASYHHDNWGACFILTNHLHWVVVMIDPKMSLCCLPVQILQFRSNRWARCSFVVSLSMLLKMSGSGRLVFWVGCASSCSWRTEFFFVICKADEYDKNHNHHYLMYKLQSSTTVNQNSNLHILYSGCNLKCTGFRSYSNFLKKIWKIHKGKQNQEK